MTRDYGTTPMVEAEVSDPDESETVLRLLDREADIETRYGGGFVQAIEGVAGTTEGDRRLDWFFYMNGIESPAGSADVQVKGGDRVWWDHHDWTDVMRVPAVVGSWPEPFLQASAEEDRLPVRVECAGDRDPCREVADRLSDEGVSVSEERFGSAPAGEALRLLVGPWSALSRDPAAALIAQGPAASGVFAEFVRDRGWEALRALNERAEAIESLGDGAGLVAAVRYGEKPPTWVVTGFDAGGIGAAVRALNEDVLRDRYAVIVAAGSDQTLPVPVVEEP